MGAARAETVGDVTHEDTWCDDCGEKRPCVTIGVRVADDCDMRDALMCRECLVAALGDFDVPDEALDAARAEVAALTDQVEALTRKLEERDADVHSRIRAGYDKTVADCWRAKVAEVERERDALRAVMEAATAHLRVIDGLCGDDYLTAERRRPRMALDAAIAAAKERA